MDSYLIVSLIVALIIGVIPAKIAQRKGKDFWTWYIYGVCLFLFAMIHAIVLPEKNETNEINSMKTVKSYLSDMNNYALNEIKYVDINCAVEARGYEIKVSQDSGLTYCSVNFFNLSDKAISSVKFIIKCYDSFGEAVETENELEVIIQDEFAKPKSFFGSNKLILLEDLPDTREVDIIVTNILFEDNSIWKKEDYELHEVKFNKITNTEKIKCVDINCPVEVRAYEIKVNEDSGLTYCSANFFNLSDKVISSVKFIIKCYDSFGQPVETENELEVIIQDESAEPKSFFGSNKLILLEDLPDTRKVDIIVTNILFEDNSIWEKEDY